MPPSYERLHYIDGWRAVAVFLVITGHLAQNGWLTYSSSAIPDGTLGVLLFFFISGYVVSKSCLNEVARTGSFSIQGFYIRRAFRIVPPLMLYLLTCLALGYFGYIDFGISAFAPSALYLCNISLFDCGWFGGHTWSLAFEEQFYLVFAIAFSAIELRRQPQLLVCIALSAIAIAPLLWAQRDPGHTGFFLIHGLFVLGYLFAKYEPLAAVSPGTCTLLFVAATAATFSVAMLPVDASMAIARFYKFIHLFTVPVMIITSKHVIGGFLGTTPMVWLGRASYSIYLWQQLVTIAPLGTLTVGQHIAAMVAALIGCLLLFVLFERPLIATGRRLAAQAAVPEVG